MARFLVKIRATAEGFVEIEADDEDEALAKGEERGMERNDYFELSDFTAVDAEEVTGA